MLILAGSGGVYLAVMLWVWYGIRRVVGDDSTVSPHVSVIVAARDEAAQIGACIRSLRQQEYTGTYDVVVVDDNSTDATARLAREAAEPYTRSIRVVSAPEQGPFRCPKKSALALGIAASRGEILLFTDADCRPSSTWIQSTVSAFAADVGMVAGFAFDPHTPTWWRGLLGLENLAVAALAAGSFGMGKPLSCTARNFAYRRSVYEAVDGYSRIGHLIGGDDVYFARLVAAETEWGMAYNSTMTGAVPCDRGAGGWCELVQQKLRHAGKAGHYGGLALVLAGMVYLFHLLLGIGLVGQLAGWPLAWPTVIALGAKTATDALVLTDFSRRLPGRNLLIYLPLLELLYVPYVLLFTVFGRLGWYRWKRR
jgi:biofilm PGA synthesis N-glycosyltransferase PgaC